MTMQSLKSLKTDQTAGQLSMLLAEIESLGNRTYEWGERIRTISDRVLGCEPENASAGGAPATPVVDSCAMAAIKRNIGHVSENIARIGRVIERLETL